MPGGEIDDGKVSSRLSLMLSVRQGSGAYINCSNIRKVRKWLNRAISDVSHMYEISAMPCTERETRSAPSEGVAENLLH